MDLFGAPEEPEEDEDESAESPEAPQQEGLASPRTASFCLGHDEIEKHLLDLVNADRMPHGLIFAGPEGIGKATMAYRLARFLLKNGRMDSSQDSLFGAPAPVMHETLDIPPGDPVFSRVSSGGHSDLLSIERPYDIAKDRHKSSVDVAEIRKVAPFLRMTAGEGGWRIVIIDDADTMNRNAQNALLKILEEPPQNVLLILIAHRPGALIPTIRSRTQTLHFQPLSSDVLKALIGKQGHNPSGSEFSLLSLLAGGSAGLALQILEADGLKMAGSILDLLENRNPVEVHKFADSTGNTHENFDLFSLVIQSVFRELAVACARGRELAGLGVHTPALQAYLQKTPLDRLLETGAALKSHLERAGYANLDRRQTILTAFSLIS